MGVVKIGKKTIRFTVPKKPTKGSKKPNKKGKKPKKGTKPGKKGKKPKKGTKPGKKGKKPKKTITRGRVRIGKTFYTYTIYGDAPWGFIIYHGKRVTFKINKKTNKAVIRIGKTIVRFTVPKRPKKSTKKPNKKGK